MQTIPCSNLRAELAIRQDANRGRASKGGDSCVVPLLTLLSAAAVIVLLNLIFYRTAIGRAFRATADDPEVAQLMGPRSRSEAASRSAFRNKNNAGRRFRFRAAVFGAVG